MTVQLAAALLTAQQVSAFFLALAILLGLSRLLGELAKRYGQPMVLGEIAAGILLGPTVLGAIAPDVTHWLFPADGPAAIALQGVILISVVFLLLVAGLEVDLSAVWRQGKAAVLVSLFGILVPFLFGFALAWVWPVRGGGGPDIQPLTFALFVGIALSITALPVIAKILMDLNMLKSDLGMLIMSGAMVNDLLGWLGFALVLAMLSGEGGNVADTVLLTLLFLGLMLTAGRWLCHRIVPYLQARWSWPGAILSFVLVLAMLCAALTEWIGIHAIFGAFVAGVAIGDTPHLRERTRETIAQFITNILAPTFFATIGLHVNFVESFNPALVIVVLVVAVAGKLLGCHVAAVLARMRRREGLAVGFGMVARGTMEIILAQLAFQANLINDELFVAIVIMALITSMISGPAMQRILQLKQVRSLNELLTEKQFIPWLTGKTAREVIDEMSARAAQLLNMPAEPIAEAVWQREQVVRTGLGDGLAVPHARLAALNRPMVVIGRSLRGVDFDAGDGRPARIIALLLTPATDPTVQIELLGMFARAFADEPSRAAAMAAHNFNEFLVAVKLPGDAQPKPTPPATAA